MIALTLSLVDELTQSSVVLVCSVCSEHVRCSEAERDEHGRVLASWIEAERDEHANVCEGPVPTCEVCREDTTHDRTSPYFGTVHRYGPVAHGTFQGMLHGQRVITWDDALRLREILRGTLVPSTFPCAPPSATLRAFGLDSRDALVSENPALRGAADWTPDAIARALDLHVLDGGAA